MAKRHFTRVRKTLKSLFCDQRLNLFANTTEFVKRHRKVKPVALFWTLVPHITRRHEVTIRLHGALSTTSRKRFGWISDEIPEIPA